MTKSPAFQRLERLIAEAKAEDDANIIESLAVFKEAEALVGEISSMEESGGTAAASSSDRAATTDRRLEKLEAEVIRLGDLLSQLLKDREGGSEQ